VSVRAFSGAASLIFTLVRRGSFLAGVEVPLQHCKLAVTAIHQVMHLALPFGGPISFSVPAHRSACLQALARECKLPAQSSALAGCGGTGHDVAMTSVPGKRGESSHRPPRSLRTIFWCLSITLCP